MSRRLPLARRVACSVAAAMLIATGCSDQGSERIAIQGTVQVEGTPIERATLILMPASQAGPPVTTRIEAGRFAFTRQTGPHAGEYIVRVNPDEASIESIIEVAEQNPRQAAREFGVQRSKGWSHKPSSDATKRIEITPQQKSPLRIDL